MDDEQSTDVAVQETDLSGINDINFDEDDSTDEPEVAEEQSQETADQEEETETTEEGEEASEQTEGTEESTEGEQSDEDKRKAFNREMAEKRIQEKQQRELSIQEQQNKYLDAAEDDKDLAVRQLQVDAYSNKVEANTNKLTNGYEKAVKDFDILTSDDPVIKARIDKAIDAFQAQYVTLDSYGNPTQISGDLYKYLQEEAESINQLTGIGARKQAENKGREKSKTLAPPSRGPKESNDKLMDALLSD